MEIKEQIEKVVASVTQNPALKEKFMSNPVEAVQEVLGTVLPGDVAEKIVAGVKAKIAGDSISGAIGKLFS